MSPEAKAKLAELGDRLRAEEAAQPQSLADFLAEKGVEEVDGEPGTTSTFRVAQ